MVRVVEQQDVARRELLGQLGGDLPRRAVQAPVVAPARPQQRRPAAAPHEREPGRAEDPERRAVAARRDAGRLGDRRRGRGRGRPRARAARRAAAAGDGRRAARRAWPAATISARQRRLAAHLLADEEERRARVRAAASASSTAGVPRGCGPSSNVSATTGFAGRAASAGSRAGGTVTARAERAPAATRRRRRRALRLPEWRRARGGSFHSARRRMIAGIAVALAAACCYELAYVVQALEARRAGGGERIEPTLLGRLLRRPRWVAATALSGVGALLQIWALTLAPLTVVQPTLALGLVLLLVLSATVLHEPVGPRELLGVAMIVARRRGRRADGGARGGGGGRPARRSPCSSRCSPIPTLLPFVAARPRRRAPARARRGGRRRARGDRAEARRRRERPRQLAARASSTRPARRSPACSR